MNPHVAATPVKAVYLIQFVIGNPLNSLHKQSEIALYIPIIDVMIQIMRQGLRIHVVFDCLQDLIQIRYEHHRFYKIVTSSFYYIIYQLYQMITGCFSLTRKNIFFIFKNIKRLI